MLFNLVELIRGKLMPAEGSAAMGLLYAGGVLLCIAVGYLLGSLNPAVLVARVGFREDIKRAGHGNAEATDIAGAYGKRAGIVTAALNFAKGFAASLLGLFIWEMNGLAISGLFALLGAMFYAGFEPEHVFFPVRSVGLLYQTYGDFLFHDALSDI